ncbi:MAG TPA: 3'-5' exonuclease [Burkholderiales bacterium]|nr:3'-5' exonuclease [Burkholderiales bacterium]
MSFWRWWARARLDADQQARLGRYRRLPPADMGRPLEAARLVVTDVESSGLRPYHDRLIAIGAVAVAGGLVRFGESFHAVLRQQTPSDPANILVHGIGGTAQVSGHDPAHALLAFLHFSGKDPLVGFHADFDRVMIERALKGALGIRPSNPWLDLAMLAPALLSERAPNARTLDDWADALGLDVYARHDALSDALTAAELLQIVIAVARGKGIRTCAELARLEKHQRWLEAR